MKKLLEEQNKGDSIQFGLDVKKVTKTQIVFVRLQLELNLLVPLVSHTFWVSHFKQFEGRS
jgi:hypothetical protein